MVAVAVVEVKSEPLQYYYYSRAKSYFQVSKVVLDVLTSIDTKSVAGVEATLSLLHSATKASLFEQVMPIFLTALCSEKICNLSICKLLAASVMELTITLTKVRDIACGCTMLFKVARWSETRSFKILSLHLTIRQRGRVVYERIVNEGEA